VPKISAEQAEDRRERIIQAAVECFSANGFHATTMRDICRAAGMSSGAVYGYFGGKEDIVEAMGNQTRGRNESAFLQAMGRENTGEVFEELLKAFFEQFKLPEGMLGTRLDILLQAEALRNQKLEGIFKTGFGQAHQFLCQVVKKGQAQGELNPELDVESAAFVLMGMVPALGLMKTFFPRLNVDDYIRVVKAMVGGDFAVKSEGAGPKPAG